MSYYKRKRGGQGTGQKPPEGSAARESVRILDMKDFNLRREMDHIVKAASRGDARIVTVGALVFLSTGDGDAWVLDVEDNLALCLMRGFERCKVEFQESAETFSIRWDSTFAIEEGSFWVTGQSERVEASPQTGAVVWTRAVAYSNYPIADLQRAMQKARKAARLP